MLGEYAIRTSDVRQLSEELWKRRWYTDDYWIAPEKLKESYHYQTHELHLPQKTILHSFNTCFIASAMNMLQIALSYVKEKTEEERRLHRLLKLALIRGSADEQLIFINNMQCLLFNPQIALNKRNRELILKNIPIITRFMFHDNLEMVVQYNIDALRNAYGDESLHELPTTVEHALRRLEPWREFISAFISASSLDYNSVFINLSEDSECVDVEQFNIIYKSKLTRDEIAQELRALSNDIHHIVVCINNAFVEHLTSLDWQRCPYLYDLCSMFNPMKVSFRTSNHLLVRLMAKTTSKLMDVPSFLYMLMQDNRIRLRYTSNDLDEFSFKEDRYYELDFNGAYRLPHICFCYRHRLSSLTRQPKIKKQTSGVILTSIVHKPREYVEIARSESSGYHWYTTIANSRSYALDDLADVPITNIRQRTYVMRDIEDEDVDDYKLILRSTAALSLAPEATPIIAVRRDLLPEFHMKIEGGAGFCYELILLMLVIVIAYFADIRLCRLAR